MNRNLWTWIQLAVSLFNAVFLVLSYAATPIAEASIAGLNAGHGAHRQDRIVAKAVQSIDSLSRFVRATL